jgi:histidinol dehydrogenase
LTFFAGPTEIAVVSETGRPDWIAADLLAQAEHDPDARAILFTPVRALALAVAAEISRQMPAEGPAAEALRTNGGLIVTDTLDEAIALAQRLAPEHAVCDTDAVAMRLTRAGTVFVGAMSAQACGDYIDRFEPRPPDERRGRGARRPERHRLRARVRPCSGSAPAACAE